MTLSAEVAYNATNTADAVTKIKDRMVTMGWTLYDDQFSASDYYIMKSTAEGASEMPFYVQLMHGITANKLTFRAYAWWDSSTHTGTCRLGTTDSEYYIGADDDSAFYIWVYGNLDLVSIISKVGTTYEASCFGKVTRFWNVEGVLQSNVTSGSNVVITLGSGEADAFIAGKTYQIVGANGEGRQPVTVDSIDTGANTVTVASLSYDFDADSRIGQTPYPWLITHLKNPNNAYWLRKSISGTGSEATDNFLDPSIIQSLSYIDPDDRADQSYILFPLMFMEADNSSLFGYFDDLCMRSSGPASYEDTMSVGELDSGTATSASSTTLVDTAQSWATDSHADKAVIITAGTGAGQIREITSNTADTLTVPAWVTPLDATSQYVICDEAWRYFYFTNVFYSLAFKEVG